MIPKRLIEEAKAMPEVKSEKFVEAQECLEALRPRLAQIYRESLDYGISIHVDEVDEERGVIILHGSKFDDCVSPFILREPALSQFEQAFKSRLPWVTRVVDSAIKGLEELTTELGVEMNTRSITG